MRFPRSPLALMVEEQGPQLLHSRCVQHRYSATGCVRCFDACPTGAIQWSDEGLQWLQGDCRGCLLCVAQCPTGALQERAISFARLIGQLAAAPRPVLACGKDPATLGHARLPCLGLLSSPELLLTLSVALSKPYVLNLSRCRDCANAEILPPLHTAMTQVQQLCDYALWGDEESQLEYEPLKVNRRDFFHYLHRQSKVALCGLLDQRQAVPVLSFGKKSLPLRRQFFQQVSSQLPMLPREKLTGQVYPRIDISRNSCALCSGCVGLCPSGALSPPLDAASPPKGKGRNCSECGLCVAFCRNDAIRIHPGALSRRLPAAALSLPK